MQKTVLVALGLACAAMAQTSVDLGIFEGASDIGAPSHRGSVTYDASRKEYRVTGGGANIWAGRDDFFFVWRKVAGDVAITADVKIVSAGVPHRKAALLIRQGLEPGSVYADAVVHGSGLTALQWRERADDVTRTVHFPLDGPTRLRLERRRNVLTLFAGKEGAPLVELGNTEMQTFSPMYAGLGVCAHDDAAQVTAIFSNVTVESLPTAATPSGKK